MKRADWKARLAAWMAARRGTPFRWGWCDCALVCVEALDAMRGSDLAVTYYGRYRTAGEALRFQRRTASLVDVLQAAGCAVAADRPEDGDIVTVPRRGFLCGHIVFSGCYVLSADLKHGVTVGRLADALAMPGARVWRAA